MVYSDELTTLNNRRRMLLDIKEIVNSDNIKPKEIDINTNSDISDYSSLKNLINLESINLKNFDTSNVKNMTKL